MNGKIFFPSWPTEVQGYGLKLKSYLPEYLSEYARRVLSPGRSPQKNSDKKKNNIFSGDASNEENIESTHQKKEFEQDPQERVRELDSALMSIEEDAEALGQIAFMKEQSFYKDLVAEKLSLEESMRASRAAARRAFKEHGHDKQELNGKLRDLEQADDYIHSIFGLDRFSSKNVEKSRNNEMCFYQPTNVQTILRLADQLRLDKDDVLYDLGSGRGVVVNLLALLTESKIKGVEFFEEYADDANKVTSELDIQNAETIQGDVREVGFSDGTVFYMFNPFFGDIMETVIKKLELIAQTRKIRICTYYNDQNFDKLPWLKRLEGIIGVEWMFLRVFRIKKSQLWSWDFPLLQCIE